MNKRDYVGVLWGLIIILLFGSLISNSQGSLPSEEWNKTYGGIGEEIAFSVQQTTDGGYILVGYTFFTFKEELADVWLVKTDAYGNEQWNKTLGGAGEEMAFSVRQTSEGGYVIAGVIVSIEGYDALLIKTDSNGNQQWIKTYGGIGADHAESVQQTSDGGYVFTGGTAYFGEGTGDIWLVKTDLNSNQQWSKAFGGIEEQAAFSIQQTSDGGYILTGVTAKSGPGSGDAWLIKTDSEGNEQWNKTFGGDGDDFVRSVQQTSDGGYILGGNTKSYGAETSDMWLIKVSGEIMPNLTTTPIEIQNPIAVPTESQTVVPTKKTTGFELVLAMAILILTLAINRKRNK